MKIMFYSHSSTVYGAPSSLLNLVTGLTRRHPEVKPLVIIPSDGPLREALIKLGINYKIIPHYRWTYNYTIYEAKRRQSRIVATAWLIKNITTRAIKNSFYLMNHLHCCRSFQPHLIYVNSVTAPMGLWIGLMEKIKVVCHYRETMDDPITGFFLDYGKSFSNRFLSKATYSVFPSEFLKKSYQWVSSLNRNLVQFNGVYFRDEIKPVYQKEKSPVWKFSMIGRISEQKGQHEAIQSFKNIKSTAQELNIYGSGVPEYVERLIALSQSSRINFLGFTQKDTIYTNTDFLVINARNESFGRVVAEANAYGVPVLAVTSGALSEIISDGINGYKFTDFRDLVQFLEKSLLSGDFNDTYPLLRQTSRRAFEENFSVERYSDRIFEHLKS